MNKTAKLVLTAAAAACVFAAGCNFKNPEDEYTSPYFFAMAADAAYAIPSSVVAEREKDCYKLYGETRDVLNGIDRSLSSTLENSCIGRFNAADAGARVEIDETAYNVLSLAKRLYEQTEGYYNPAVYYNVIAYGFGGASEYPDSAEKMPSDEEIDKYTQLSKTFGEVALETSDGKYFATKPDFTVSVNGATYSLKIDLGGIGKGYAVDVVSKLMDKHSMPYGYFTFGDSSITFKKFSGADSDNYILGLTNPRYTQGSARQYVNTNVKDTSLSTSGDNVQYYTVDGVRYCHIINPMTGKPVQTGVMSATVLGPDAAANDAYTTAIMAMGKEKAVQFINETLAPEGIRVVFACDNGGKYEIVSNIPAEELTIKADDFKLVNKLEDGKIVLVD